VGRETWDPKERALQRLAFHGRLGNVRGRYGMGVRRRDKTGRNLGEAVTA